MVSGSGKVTKVQFVKIIDLFVDKRENGLKK